MHGIHPSAVRNNNPGIIWRPSARKRCCPSADVRIVENRPRLSTPIEVDQPHLLAAATGLGGQVNHEGNEPAIPRNLRPADAFARIKLRQRAKVLPVGVHPPQAMSPGEVDVAAARERLSQGGLLGCVAGYPVGRAARSTLFRLWPLFVRLCPCIGEVDHILAGPLPKGLTHDVDGREHVKRGALRAV